MWGQLRDVFPGYRIVALTAVRATILYPGKTSLN